MKHILVVSGNALAHLTRPLSVARPLQERGYTVSVAGEIHKWASIIRANGYEVIDLPLNIDGKALNKGSLALSTSVVRQAIDHDRALLRRLKPRLVLLDWRHSMRLAAALEHIPVVAFANAQVTKVYAGPLVAPLKHPLTRLAGRRLANRLMPLFAPWFFRAWARPYQAYARAHGHAGWRDLRDYIAGDTTLLADLPSLAPIKTADDSYTYIGPLAQYPFPSEPLPPLADPVLYITFGSETAAKYRDAVVQATQGWPGSVVVTTGGDTLEWPGEWIARPYIKPLELSKQHQLTWLFHGGNGTSYQMLQAWQADQVRCGGAVILPFHVDHQWNAARLARLGAVRAIVPIDTLHDPAQQAVVAQALSASAQQALPAMPPELRVEIERYSYTKATERALRTID
nr:hypothetical protein [Herpetosiphonaceae bacterium]